MKHLLAYFSILLFLFSPLNSFAQKTDFEIMDSLLISNPDSAYIMVMDYEANLDENGKTLENAEVYLVKGQYFRQKGDYDSSLVFFYRAVEIFDDLDEFKGYAESKLEIGIVNDLQKLPKEAILNYKEALKVYKSQNDSMGMVKSMMNIAISFKNRVFREENMAFRDSARYYYQQIEPIVKATDNGHAHCKLFINMGNLSYQEGKFQEAADYYHKAHKLAVRFNFASEMALSLDNLGWAYTELKDYKKAQDYAMKGYEVAKEYGLLYSQSQSLQNIARISAMMGDFETAYGSLMTLINVDDTLYEIQTVKMQKEMDNKFEISQREKKIALLNKEKEKDAALAEEERKRQLVIILGVVAGLILVSVFSFFLYKRFKITQKQKVIIEHQKEEVDQKNKDITDSINYAKKIQTALLSNERVVLANLPNHFIYFKPKDIVSGDFYWMKEEDDYLYMTVADCTGHGVPGAMLTMLGTSFLNQITMNQILTPAEILDQLREKIIAELSQKKREEIDVESKTVPIKDGMDISLIRLNKKTNELDWSGAYNPLWIITDNKELLDKFRDTKIVSNENKSVITVAADKQPIGVYSKMTPFTNHSLQLKTGDAIYLFSDGFADQFGSKNKKKYKSGNFKKFLLSISEIPMTEQIAHLDKEFMDWKGDLEQLDDVCVIGIRV